MGEMGEAATSELNVAITCSRKQYLTQYECNEILSEINKQIISDACSPQQGKERPTFNTEPLFKHGAIQLWCGNVYTLTWLKETVRKLSVPSCPSLEVKSQSEVQKRTVGTFTFVDRAEVFQGRDSIMRTLWYQNPSIDFNGLEPFEVSRSHTAYPNTWIVSINFAEDQKRALENAGCKLSIGLTAVNVEFAK